MNHAKSKVQWCLDKAKKEVKADLPNTQKTSETLLEKYASAFTYDQFEIKL